MVLYCCLLWLLAFAVDVVVVVVVVVAVVAAAAAVVVVAAAAVCICCCLVQPDVPVSLSIHFCTRSSELSPGKVFLTPERRPFQRCPLCDVVERFLGEPRVARLQDGLGALWGVGVGVAGLL